MNPLNQLLRYGLAVSLVAACQNAAGATRFSPEFQPLGSLAPLVLTDTDLSGGGVKAYRPWFENGAWQGDLVEYSVSTAGALSTSVNLSGSSPANPDASPANWSAHVQFAAAEAADPDYWDTGREIVTWDGTTQVPFRWGASAIGTTNMALIDKLAYDNSDTSSDILDFIRGDRSKEYPATEALRSRISIMGDIIHSTPVYVSAPVGSRTDNNYASWAASKINREARVYVGANDGMLHAFDAATGNEVWAYIPSMLMADLDKLAARPYIHNYFVDGKLTVTDAYFDSTWHTVLVGGLGAGGRGYFGLDITDADLDNEAATAGSDIKVLWELDDSGDDDLGDSFSSAGIAQLNDGNWYALFGNGYNSVNGIAKLYIVNIKTGAVLRKISTGSGTSGSPNGLSSPAMLDKNKDGKVDYVYAGDIDGNLWKFDLSSTDKDDWSEAYGRPLHPGSSTQPITTAPEIALHENRGYMIYFATGRLLTPGDLENTDVQAMYGIWDSGATPPTADTQALHSQTFQGASYTSGTISESVVVYNPDAGDVDWSSKDGWMAAFPAGYRVLDDVQLRASRVKATVHLPSNQNNFIAEAAIYDGGPHETPIYDLDRNGVLGSSDLVDGNADGDVLDSEDVPMAWRKPDGIMSQVTIARVASGVDTMMLNYVTPPVEEPCTGDCTSGFQGGHIDVDTYHDDEDLGGGSTKHTHEYDKKSGRVYVDYFDINVAAPAGAVAPIADITDHIEIDDDSDIGDSTEFVVLVANADFSRGSEIQIGTKTWNVVDYQREIHTALKNWDASDADDELVDSDGDSLIFTIGGIRDAGGTISHSFNDLAIISGGLHPTQTGCVKSDGYETFDASTLEGRYRNGALVTMLVRASHFTSSSAIEDVDIQKPDDLPEDVIIGDGTQYSLSEDFDGDGTLEWDNHEYFGGLLARSGSELAWESTLFWHFGKLYDAITGGGKPCYGDANWADAVALETAENVAAIILDAYGFEGSVEDLKTALEDKISCADSKKYGGDGSCKDEYNDLIKLYDLIASYGGSGGSGSGSPLDDTDDDPHVMGGGAEGLGFVSGVDFEFGRLGWTDLSPRGNSSP